MTAAHCSAVSRWPAHRVIRHGAGSGRGIAASPDHASVPPEELRRVAAASFIGTSLEWYDFFLYGTAAALVFDKLFFPELSELAGTLAAFGTYAVGFVARPIGAAVFGHYGDRIGRKRMLVTTLLIMGVATTLIGALPTYASIGILAPVLLVVLRFVQGFAVGGEWGGAVLMAVESAPPDQRGAAGAWPQLGSPAGLILSSLVFVGLQQLPGDAFLDWGWRVAFGISVLLVLVGLVIRLRVVESPVFEQVEQAEAKARIPAAEVFREHWPALLRAMGIIFVGIGGFYVITTFMLAYATDQVGLTDGAILAAVTFGGIVELVAIRPFGRLSDRFGRRPVAGFGALGMVLLAFPLFWLVDTAVLPLVWLGIGLIILAASAHYGVIAAYVAELFDARIRYSGIALSYQLSGAIGGATAPLVATALLDVDDGASWPVAIYLALMALVSVMAIALSPETRPRKVVTA